MLLLAVMHSMMSAMMLARMTILMGNGLDEERSRLGGLEHVLHHQEAVRLGTITLVEGILYDRTLGQVARHCDVWVSNGLIRMQWRIV